LPHSCKGQICWDISVFWWFAWVAEGRKTMHFLCSEHKLQL